MQDFKGAVELGAALGPVALPLSGIAFLNQKISFEKSVAGIGRSPEPARAVTAQRKRDAQQQEFLHRAHSNEKPRRLQRFAG